MNQLCRVCSEPAAGFHFGAFTCEGCKSFFGRTYNNLSQIHECKTGGNCVINKQNRTTCKACRLRKCLIVGMSKSGSRYGRRSNWFKIHCALQEQAAKLNRELEGGGPINLPLNATQSAISRLSPSTCIEDEGKLGSPALSSPDSNTSDTSVDIEPRRSRSCSSLQSAAAPLTEPELLIAQELKNRTTSALATVGGRGLTPPIPGTDFVAGLSFYGLHSGISFLQASQIYQRLCPQFLYNGIRPILDSVPQPHEASTAVSTSFPNISTPSNPPSPSNSLPTSSVKREHLSNPSTPQSLPAQPFTERQSPTSISPSPPLPSRKRQAEPEQDAPIDLSLKRPKLDIPGAVAIPDLTPISLPFNFITLPTAATTSASAVPVDLTTNA